MQTEDDGLHRVFRKHRPQEQLLQQFKEMHCAIRTGHRWQDKDVVRRHMFARWMEVSLSGCA